MSIDAPELAEVVVTSDADANLWSVAAWDPWSGASVVTYKGEFVRDSSLAYARLHICTPYNAHTAHPVYIVCIYSVLLLY